MWDTISNVLTSSNANSVLLFALLVLIIIGILLKAGVLRVHTKYLTLSERSGEQERKIIREQCDWAHGYLMGLEGKLSEMVNIKEQYRLKYILELVYDDVIKWITFNHIEDSEAYVSIKQHKVKSLIYSVTNRSDYQTHDFEKTLFAWVDELIHRLIDIRKIYSH